jgi:hypothetical protein
MKSHPHMTQAAIALYFEKEWNLQFKITKSTLSYIMTNTAKKIVIILLERRGEKCHLKQ